MSNFADRDCVTCSFFAVSAMNSNNGADRCISCVNESNWYIRNAQYENCDTCQDADTDWCDTCAYNKELNKDMTIPQDDDVVVTNEDMVDEYVAQAVEEEIEKANYVPAEELFDTPGSFERIEDPEIIPASEYGLNPREQSDPVEVDPNGIAQHAPGAKMDAGKARWSLLPWKIISAVVKVYTEGAAKYSDNGWKDVEGGEERYFDAMMRHRDEILDGHYVNNTDFGLPNWAHFVWNAIAYAWFVHKRTGI